jgi:hypothetical protein
VDISVYSPGFSKDFLTLVHTAQSKGAELDIVSNPSADSITAFVTRGDRTLGVFVFTKTEDGYELKKKKILEKHFNPWELTLFWMTKYAKKHQVKNIIINI